MEQVLVITEEAPGAWKNGTRVAKVKDDPGDTHTLGAPATILGSVGPMTVEGRKVYGYFVEWDDCPGIPVFVADYKIAPVS